MPRESTPPNPPNRVAGRGAAYDLPNAEIVARFLAGESCKRIAKTLGVSPIVIRLRVEKAGATRPNARRRAMPDTEIVSRYVAGESEFALAITLGVSRQVIRRRLAEANVKIRGSAEVNRTLAAARTPEQHRANTMAAHDAVRGKTQTVEHRAKIAATKQVRRSHVVPSEDLLELWLRDRGIKAIPQQAIGPYNADIGVAPVAVEIFGGNWHGYGHHAKRAPKRLRYLFDAGWNVLVVWVNRSHRLRPSLVDEIIAFVERSRSDPAFRREHRVVWGDGQPAPEQSLNLDERAVVPADD